MWPNLGQGHPRKSVCHDIWERFSTRLYDERVRISVLAPSSISLPPPSLSLLHLSPHPTTRLWTQLYELKQPFSSNEEANTLKMMEWKDEKEFWSLMKSVVGPPFSDFMLWETMRTHFIYVIFVWCSNLQPKTSYIEQWPKKFTPQLQILN